MSSRAADATIKGYYYQFDTTILKLLDLPSDSDHVIVEGIEDIDINTATDSTTVQCKYLSKPNFINSAVREPIILMLDHYLMSTTPKNLNYVLYAHFEKEKPGSEPLIGLTELKDILTFKESKITKSYFAEKGISDAQLADFLKHFKLLFGIDFNLQQQLVLSKLKSKFSCSDFEADTFFYNNALRIVIDKAIIKDANNRKLIKSDFIKNIDSRKLLFNEWYLKLRTKKQYLDTISKNLQITKALEPSRSKCIIIGNLILSADNGDLPPSIFIDNLINKYYRINRAFRNAQPLLLVLDCDNSMLTTIKKELISQNIYFNDGYEHIAFNPMVLNRMPVINTASSNTKIVKTSYSVKMISLDTFIAHQKDIEIPKVILHFSKKDCPYSKSSTYQLFNINYCEDLKDISTIIL
jgi:hypothetical protein